MWSNRRNDLILGGAGIERRCWVHRSPHGRSDLDSRPGGWHDELRAWVSHDLRVHRFRAQEKG